MKSRLCLGLVLGFVASNCLIVKVLRAQDFDRDSLRRVIATTPSDTVRGRSWCRLCHALQRVGLYDSARAANDQGRQLLERVGDYRGLGMCYLELGRLERFGLGRFDSADVAYAKAQAMRWKAGFVKGAADAVNERGTMHWNQGLYRQAQAFFEQAIRLYRHAGDSLGLSNGYYNLCNAFIDQGLYKPALDNCFKALRIREVLGNRKLLAENYNGLGIVYMDTRNYTLALDYFQKSLAINRATENLSAEAGNLINMGLAYASLKQYERAIALYKEGIAKSKAARQDYFLANGLTNLANVHLDHREPQSALKYLSQARPIYKRLASLSDLAGNHINTASAYLQLGQFARARAELLRGIALADSSGQLEFHRNGLLLLARADSALGNWQAAYQSLHKGRLFSDSLYNNEKSREMGRLEAEFQYEKQTEDLRRRTETEKRLLQTRTRWIVGSIAAGLLAVLVITFTLHQSRQKMKRANAELRRLNQQITQQKAEIEAQTSEIIAQRDQLEATNARLVRLDRVKEELSAMIVHDLKNPLNVVLAMAAQPPDVHRQHIIRAAGQQIANLVSNLLDIHKYEDDALKLKTELVQACRLLYDACAQTEFLAHQKNIRFDIQVSSELVVEADPELLVRVVVNLLTNAIKYAPNGDTLVLEAYYDTDQGAVFRVTDHGQGIPPEYLESVFEKFSQVDGGQASGQLRSTGLGLTFCKLTVEAHGGSIRAHSEVGRYTTIEFNLPTAWPDAQVSQASPQVKLQGPVGPLPPALQRAYAAVLDQLRQLPPYELSTILDMLDALPDTPYELRAWKSAVEAAVLAADAPRLRELLA